MPQHNTLMEVQLCTSYKISRSQSIPASVILSFSRTPNTSKLRMPKIGAGPTVDNDKRFCICFLANPQHRQRRESHKKKSNVCLNSHLETSAVEEVWLIAPWSSNLQYFCSDLDVMGKYLRPHQAFVKVITFQFIFMEHWKQHYQHEIKNQFAFKCFRKWKKGHA